ncbi:MAG: LysR family transcriptional regulator [Methanosphaera stadtmanae]|nr:LysR family transcriptional regulator [Methanosphaera stadtmanae]
MSYNRKLDFEIDNVLFNYKLFDTLKAVNKTKSQRKAAKELGISHSVLNRRILNAEQELSHQLVLVTNKGSSLTEYAFKLLDDYVTYEERLKDDENLIKVAGGPISCEFIRHLARAYNLHDIRFISTDKNTAFKLADMGMVDILGFDDPVQAYLLNLEPIPLGRDNLVLMTHENEVFSNINDLNGLNFVEVEDSAHRLAWTTLANYDLDFDIVDVVTSFNEAIKLVEENKNLYTFINNSMSYRCLHTSNILSQDTQHIISALNVKNDDYVDNFLNFASHHAQNTTLNFGFGRL